MKGKTNNKQLQIIKCIKQINNIVSI